MRGANPKMIQHRQVGETLHLGLFTTLRGSSDESLAKIPKAKKLIVHVDSMGGCAQLACDVASAILKHPDSTAYVHAAQSAAAIISRSCQRVVIDPAGKMMVHGASTTVHGDEFDLVAGAHKLRLINRRLGEILTFRLVRPDVIDRMADGEDHHFSAEEALAAGLVDEISADHPEWPTPPWAAELEHQPASPDERILLEILDAVGPIEVADIDDFSRRLNLWFTRRVRGK